MKWLVMPALWLVLLCAAYLVGHHNGYSDASAACQSASLQSQLSAQKQVADNLKAQVAKQQTAIAVSETSKKADHDLVMEALSRAPAIPMAKDCSLGPEAVALLNVARAGAK